MSTFIPGRFSENFDPSLSAQNEQTKREAFDRGMGDFFDPAVDQHSEFYAAMEKDKHAAHLVAGTSFLDLNTMILKTECNNAYESMNEDDMQRLRKLMWEVYVPHMKQTLESKLPVDHDDMQSFQAQMHVVHISVRVAQALQLIFELNQKKSFSSVAKTAYEVALQDCLYHPHLKGKVKSIKYGTLINFLRRHPTYSTPFNTYVGYKLLRQQLVRGGGAGTNRKSNDAERLHDEAANRLWRVLDENRTIHAEFTNATPPFIMDWHRLYYKEVADTLFQKLTAHTDDAPMSYFSSDSSANRAQVRKDLEQEIRVQEAQNVSVPGAAYSGVAARIGTSTTATTDMGRKGYNTSDSVAVADMDKSNGGGVDILNAIQDSRNTFSEGITKRVPVNIPSTFSKATLVTLGSSNNDSNGYLSHPKRSREN